MLSRSKYLGRDEMLSRSKFVGAHTDIFMNRTHVDVRNFPRRETPPTFGPNVAISSSIYALIRSWVADLFPAGDKP